MFYGDLISNLFLRTLTASTTSTPSLCSAVETASLRNNTLPSILTPLKAKKVCSPVTRPLLSFDFSDPENKLNTSYYMSMSNATSWEFVEDRPNKFGLVSEFTVDTTAHCIRWDVDAMPVSKEYRLSVRYMRTYLNAGVRNMVHFVFYILSASFFPIQAAEVLMCGQYIRTLNALWEDFITYHVSIPFEEIIDLSTKILTKNCKEERPFIEVCHYLVTDPRRKSPSEMAARTERQKFKLLSIEVCELAYD